MVLTRTLWIGFRYLILLIAIAVLAKPLFHTGEEIYYRMRSEWIWERWETMGDSLAFVPAGWLRISDIDFSSLVIYDATKDNLDKFPSMISLGNDNNGLQLIMAHRDVHFFPLKDCAIGQRIDFETKRDGIISYEIVDIEILDTALAEKKVIEKKEEDWLVLLTCYPFSYLGSAPKRYLVWCKKQVI